MADLGWCASLTAVEAFQGQAVGDLGGAAAVGRGALEDLLQGVAYAFDMRLELRSAATGALVADIDNAAGVDRIIRRVQALVATQGFRQAGIGQLVVGGPGDNRRAQDFQGLQVDDAAHGAGREYIHLQGEYLLLGHGGCTQLLHRAAYIGRDYIGNPQLSPGLVEVPRQAEAHLAHALDRHFQAAQVVTAQTVFDRRLDADKYPVGRGRRRVAIAHATLEAFALSSPGHMAGALGHDLHFRNAGARIRRGDIAAAQAVDEVTHGLEQRGALAAMRVTHDHRLAATQRQPGEGRLVTHAARQAQHIA